MIIIRPVKQQDIDLFSEFSFESLLGMTNLPRNREKLLEKIIHSEKCFSHEIKKSGDEEYTFVLEDLTTGRIGGTSGILANSAHSFQYCYRIKTISTNTKNTSSPKDSKILKIELKRFNASEICSVDLETTYRNSGQ